MAISVLFNPPSMTAAQYDEIIRRLEKAGALALPGMLHHTCFGPGSMLSVHDVWESQATFDAFAQKLMPILGEVGVDPGTPAIQPVHKIMP
jgi:hypothetical protein